MRTRRFVVRSSLRTSPWEISLAFCRRGDRLSAKIQQWKERGMFKVRGIDEKEYGPVTGEVLKQWLSSE